MIVPIRDYFNLSLIRSELDKKVGEQNIYPLRVDMCWHIRSCPPLCYSPFSQLYSQKVFALAVDKRIRQFIWSEYDCRHKIHLLNWETVTKPKEFGGLGLKSIHAVNLAFMEKIGCRFLTDAQAF